MMLDVINNYSWCVKHLNNLFYCNLFNENNKVCLVRESEFDDTTVLVRSYSITSASWHWEKSIFSLFRPQQMTKSHTQDGHFILKQQTFVYKNSINLNLFLFSLTLSYLPSNFRSVSLAEVDCVNIWIRQKVWVS